MKRIKTKWFNSWAKKNKINDISLFEGITNLENNLSTVSLGSSLYKVRISRKGAGKSSGFRTIIVFKSGEKAIYIYGFAKNEQDNISSTELSMFKKLGKDLLRLNDTELNKAVSNNALHLLEEK